MTGPEFSAEDVERLRQNLTNELNLSVADEERELLGVIFDAASAQAASGSQRVTFTKVDVGSEELTGLLSQFLGAYTPGDDPGLITQINVFYRIKPGEPGG